MNQKWCFLHKTDSHGDSECYTQGAPRSSQKHGAHIVFAILSAKSLPENDEEKPSNFDNGYAFTELVADKGGRTFDPKADRIMMVWTSGASDHLLDDDFISRLQDSVKDF
ncbi:MAG: hypothetical protein ABJQ90_16360 [Parasphingorhabdus sp.]